jgi:hypothetical protein
MRAEKPNSVNSPGSTSPPDQVTVWMPSVISESKTTRGSSNFPVFSLRSQPGASSKLTNAIGGKWTSTFVVEASSLSLGTRTTKRENEPATASFG